jgi:prepilin-type N-terminal cleavage/methylation domain-containing protein
LERSVFGIWNLDEGVLRTFSGNAGTMKRVRLSSKIRRACQGSSSGFTLIEVLIALALIGIIAIAFLSALSTGSMALITADERATAESLARSQMEYVKNQGYSPAPTGGVGNYTKIGVPAGYTICSYDRTEDPVNCDPNDFVIGIPWDNEDNQPVDEDNGLQRIKLVIKRDGKEVITLEGYKRLP